MFVTFKTTISNCNFIYITLLYFIISAFTGFETNNKYEIKNSMGQRVYFAAEGKKFISCQVLLNC